MLKRTVLAALALACAAPVAAETVTVAVPYGDLDLTKEAGRDALDARLERATRRVCGIAPVRDLQQMAGYRACIVAARESTREQVALALNAANARRVAVLSDKLFLLASF
jgi:UrcA family protein